MDKLALDFDSVLAATHETAADLLGVDYGYSDIESWNWPLDKFGTDAALSALWHAWTIRPLDVPVMEPKLSDTTTLLNRVFDVDIVTAHPDQMGIADGKKKWLDEHDIEYDNFVVAGPGSTKAEMNYDVFIDDKPKLVGKVRDHQRLYLRDHRYNREELLPEGDYTRVDTVRDVLRIESKLMATV